MEGIGNARYDEVWKEGEEGGVEGHILEGISTWRTGLVWQEVAHKEVHRLLYVRSSHIVRPFVSLFLISWLD